MSAFVKKNQQQFELTIQEQDYRFTVGREDYNKYINSVTQKNKVAPSHNFLIETVDDDCKAALKTLLQETPGADVSIASELMEAYTPDLNIAVKKLSSAQND